MRGLLSILLLISLMVASAGCGNVFVSANFQTSTVSGIVSLVQVSSVVTGDGSTVVVTFVTFFQAAGSTTIGFCGDQQTQFPMDKSIRANFTPGQTCATVVQIVIM